MLNLGIRLNKTRSRLAEEGVFDSHRAQYYDVFSNNAAVPHIRTIIIQQK